MFAKLKKIERELVVVGAGLVLVCLAGCRIGNEGPVETRSLGVVKGCAVSYVEGMGPYPFTLVECEGGQQGLRGETAALSGKTVAVREVGTVKGRQLLKGTGAKLDRGIRC